MLFKVIVLIFFLQRVGSFPPGNILDSTSRSSHPEFFCKKCVPKDFAIFKGKHLCWISFNKVAGLKPPTQAFFCKYCKIFKSNFFYRPPFRRVTRLLCNFIEIAPRHGCCHVTLPDIFRTPFPKNTFGWLLLYINLQKIYHHELEIRMT